MRENLFAEMSSQKEGTSESNGNEREVSTQSSQKWISIYGNILKKSKKTPEFIVFNAPKDFLGIIFNTLSYFYVKKQNFQKGVA